MKILLCTSGDSALPSAITMPAAGRQGDLPSRIEVLGLLQEEISRRLGGTLASQQPITADTNLCTLQDADIDALDAGMQLLGGRISEKFGIEIRSDDWDFLSGFDKCDSYEEWRMLFMPMFTVGRLADLIVARMQIVIVTPVTILGVSSRSAAAFRLIEEMAARIRPGIPRLGPSAAITDYLRSANLDRFWTKVRAISGGRLQPLPATHIDWIGGLLSKGLVVLILLTIALVALPLVLWFFPSHWRWVADVAEWRLIAMAFAICIFGMTLVAGIAFLILRGALRRWAPR